MSGAHSIRPGDRHSAAHPCPVCGGYDDLRRGAGERCIGFVSGDFIHCSREESAGLAKPHPASQTWSHKASGPCPCGYEHRPAEPNPGANVRAEIVATYNYRDQAGNVLFQALRMKPKAFRQRRPDPTAKGGWAWNLKGVTTIPYRLPELLASDHSATVYIVEGEKDADRLAEFGLIATTNPMGAGKWRDTYSPYFEGRDVVIIGDNDQTGRDHAEKVARALSGIAATVKVLELRGLAERGDVSDWLNGKHSIGDLKALAGAAPPWTPCDPPSEGESDSAPLALTTVQSRNGHMAKTSLVDFSAKAVNGNAGSNGNGHAKISDKPSSVGRNRVFPDDEDAPRFANYKDEKDEDGKDVKTALRVGDLDDSLRIFASVWPKRVVDTLFWESEDHLPVYFRSSAQLFAWIDKQAQVDWTKGVGKFIPQERFFEHRRMTSKRYEAIETIPHWPELPGVYYMYKPVSKSEGKLGELVDFFCPATDEDRELIIAMILTMLWGGSPGQRPAFLLTGPDIDEEQGRGVGKSACAQILAQGLAGGFIDVSPTDQIATVKTRLLSEGGSQARVAMLDNIKALRFSWADLEGLITSQEISGRALYVGEGRRPNTLVWIMTLNGASLSKDMAQRVICIKLNRPSYRDGWEKTVRSYIAEHRPAILAEIRDLLLEEPGPIVAGGRWASWQSAVLSKLPRAEKCQKLIAERQASIDDDNEERDLVAGRFRGEILRCKANPETESLFITSFTACRWINRATNRNMSTNQASSFLRGLGVPELRKSKSNRKDRGWYWIGRESNPASDSRRISDPEEGSPVDYLPFSGDGGDGGGDD
jgi:5S rRNA maturation endonuclease (ribonuclease M5)